MNEKYYVVNKRLKRKLLKKYIKNRTGYKKWAIISSILNIFALCILVFFIVLGYVGLEGKEMNLDIIVAALGMGVFFGCFPFVIANYIITKVKREYGFPYNTLERECFFISDDGIKFGYHDIESEYVTNMDVYEIPIRNINDVKYDSEYNILTIIGVAKLTSYDDFQSKKINYEASQQRFYSDSPYEIMLPFDESEEIVKLLKLMAKNYIDK